MLQDATSLIPQLVQSFGPAGASFGIMLYVMIRQNKKYEQRITDLEKSQDEQYLHNLDMHKQMISDYIDLVRNKTQVLSDLTQCLTAMKDTLDRLERKGTL